MSDFHDAARGGLSAGELEAVLRQVGAERYHNRHPFHHRMTGGALSKVEMQAWALNRYCYQAVIPRKDAMILARAEDPAFRAAWRKRIEDHDGDDGWSGGIARWLHLATSLGLDADDREERAAGAAGDPLRGRRLSLLLHRADAARSGRLVADRAVLAGHHRRARAGDARQIRLRHRGHAGLFQAAPGTGVARCRLRARLCARACRHAGAPAGGDRRAGVQM